MRIEIDYTDDYRKRNNITEFKDTLVGLLPTRNEHLAVCKIEDFETVEEVKIPNEPCIDMTPIEFEEPTISRIRNNDYHIEYKRNCYYKFTIVKDLQRKQFEERIINCDDIKSIKFNGKWW